ncbi:MAG TPA: hypothetical protein DCR40_10325 [Prolixibacteraceae bacterium]|nr:hypothetical protein [Prolixibacteraceae bacterium]
MQNYNLADHNSNNTFEGVEFILPNEDAYSLAYAAVKIQVRASVGSPVLKEFKTSDGTLVINQPWTITVPQQLVKLAPGTYQWDLKIIFIDGRNKTYIGGKWTIKPVITSI